MTTPSPEVLESEKDKLFVTDAELIRRLGVPTEYARPALRELDSKLNSGFPRKLKLWGDRRYWPAVLAYFNQTYGGSLAEETKGNGNGASVHRERTRPTLQNISDNCAPLHLKGAVRHRVVVGTCGASYGCGRRFGRRSGQELN